MTPFPNVFEGSVIFPKKEESKAQEEVNVKVEALTDRIDYSKKMETFNGYISDIEQGLYEEEYEFIDKETGVSFMGDPRNSLVSVSNDSSLLKVLEKNLLELGYQSKRGSLNTVFAKLFSDRKVSSLF